MKVFFQGSERVESVNLLSYGLDNGRGIGIRFPRMSKIRLFISLSCPNYVSHPACYRMDTASSSAEKAAAGTKSSIMTKALHLK
jgi:hypothetical protein